MKIYIHNIFKPFLVLALSALAFASCMQQVDEEMVSATGYLSAPALDVDVTVEDLMGTKAVEGFTVDQPNVADFRYVVKDKDGAVKYDATGLWESLMLPVGKYSVEAFHGTNGFGAPYFYGKTPSDAVIAAGRQNTPNLTAQVNNAVVRVRVDSDFAKHFTLSSVELTSDGVTKTLTAVEIADWYFVPSGAELTIKLIGESNAGVYKEFTHVITPSAKSANDIVCRQDGNNMPSITLPDQSAGAWATRLYITPATFTNISAANQAKLVYEVIPEGGDWASAKAAEQIEGQYYVVKDLSNGSRYTVRARIGNLTAEQTVEVKENLEGFDVKSEHYKDAGGNLAGTNSTLSVGLTGILKTLNDAGLLQLTGYTLSNDKGVVRTASAAGLMTQTDGWPYLPQGSNYVLTINHKISNETYAVSSVNHNYSVPEPPIVLTLTSYSSYDKYLEFKTSADSKALEKANGMVASTIEGMGVTWNISADLIANGNYSKSLTYQGTPVSEISGTSYSTNDVTNLALGGHSVSASMTFAGTSKSVSKTHYITGLPYSINIEVSNPTGWTLHNTPFDNGRLYFKIDDNDSNRGYAVSPKYYIPDDIEVKYDMIGYFYCSAAGSGSCTIYVEPTSETSTKSQSSAGHKSNKGNINYPATHDGNSYKGDTILTDLKPYMCISHNGSTGSWQTRRLYFYGFSLYYR